MASIRPDYEYDIFISYRHNDNRSGWVTEFVKALEEELAATIKEPVSVYFDTNPHDGLLETHDVDGSLKEKIRCLVFIPIVSQTFCDPRSFAWQNEFLPFLDFCRTDDFGLEIKLPGGNVSKRVLPVRIHEIDAVDKKLFEKEIGGSMRPIDFIFKSSGVNRPLLSDDKRDENSNKTVYRDQINKVANAINDILKGVKVTGISEVTNSTEESAVSQSIKLPFSTKLTRRNILRASLAYILTALLLWKILLISSSLLHLSENIIQVITFILMLLFPFAMVLAWLYERSPSGFIRTGSVASLVNPYPGSKKKPFTSYAFISILVVTTVALFLFFPQSNRAKSNSINKNVIKSIAVLPFKNDSNDSSNVYIVNGLMESILNNLGKIKDLNVISRTSVEKYRDKTEQTPVIAKELNVNYIIEGSGQKYGDDILLTVQLLEASTDKHLWSNQYKRNSRDIIDLQIDVAKTIANEIKAIITPEEEARIKKAPTKNIDAYNLYIKGIELLNKTYVDSANINKAKTYLEQAVELDKEFALAYAELARVYLLLYRRTGKNYLAQINYYADKAMLYDPNLDFSLIAKGTCFALSGDYETALPYFEKALLYNPNSYFALRAITNFYGWQRPNTEKFMEYALRVMQVYVSTGDTIVVQDYVNLGNALRQSGFFNEAEKYFEKAIKINPENKVGMVGLLNDRLQHRQAKEMLMSLYNKDTSNINVIRTLGLTSYYMRDYQEAFKYYKRMIEYNNRNNTTFSFGDYGRIGLVYSKLGMETESGKFFRMNLDYIEPLHNVNTYRHQAAYYAYTGNIPKAIENMKIVSQQENYPYWVIMNFKADPLFDNIRELPQFKMILREMETNFQKNHDRIEASLKEKGLL